MKRLRGKQVFAKKECGYNFIAPSDLRSISPYFFIQENNYETNESEPLEISGLKLNKSHIGNDSLMNPNEEDEISSDFLGNESFVDWTNPDVQEVINSLKMRSGKETWFKNYELILGVYLIFLIVTGVVLLLPQKIHM